MSDAATEAQNRAARPHVSTWLSANAGSGKTRVLTSRVARLLLKGVRPQNILCLTYTKAAASEMQNRLFKTLGRWAMLADGALHDELTGLGEAPPDDLARARTLFASAIEAPGGLKIQTIHSLCSGILRQFPLEAGVNPQFREMDEAAQATVLDDVLETLAARHPGLLERVSAVRAGESAAELARDVAKHADRFTPDRSAEEIFAGLGVPVGETVEGIVSDAIRDGDLAFLRSMVAILRRCGSTTDQKLADVLAGLPDTPSVAALIALENCLLTKSGQKPFSAKMNIPTKGVKEDRDFAPLLPDFVDIIERVEAARPRRIALEAAEQAVVVHEFARAFLPLYEEVKAERGLLDFDDLIRRTKALLTTQSLQWVMYRLDGRIDHILVDEAQDTSPEQWDVIEALAEEIAAGESDRERTLFVVGDKKQSIYSFQGADAAGFDRRRAGFEARLAEGQGLEEGELLHSFRSSPAILTAVDKVFTATPSTGVGGDVRHRAFFPEMPGRVDLWPLVPRQDKADDLPWYDRSPRVVENKADIELARDIAGHIETLLKTGTIQGKAGGWRRVRAGDIMVLVQRRSTLFDQIIAACKARRLDVAGADRMRIGSELAVRDLLALLSFLALPDDSLSLATALRSPLFGWSERELYELAAKRPERAPLWKALRDRREEFPETHAALAGLRARVDFLRPYELLDAILTGLQGRRHLLERLGPEAEDGIDELLSQALAFERDHVPSLTGFLSAARISDSEVKRETDTSGNLIRVMTVHAAKGLESPIVILPDTTFVPGQTRQGLIEGPDGIPILPRGKDRSPPAVQAAKEARSAAEAEERDRLLYVAMTRAERWLIVAGVQPPKNSGDRINWHKMVSDGLEQLETQPIDTPAGEGRRFSFGNWPEMADSSETETEPLPEVALAELPPAAPEPERQALHRPSDLGGEKVLGGGALEEAEAKRRGSQVHLLLEHLPGAPDREATARRLLSAGPLAASRDAVPGLLAEAARVVDAHPDVFSADALAEVDIAADLPALGARMSGTIDRLLVTPERVLAVDFKTNAVVPERPEDTPEGLKRQMGAYLAALETLYPDRPVDVAILWTATGALMVLEHGMVRAALERAQHLDLRPRAS